MNTAGLDLLRVNPRTYARTADRTIADPTLFLNFTSATSLDPRITFTRGSQATLFDSTGTLKYAKHNLLLQSEDFSTTWAATGATVTTNATTAPSGSATADKLIADSAITVSPSSVSAFVRQDITKAATATTYTFSLFAKAGEFNAVRLFARDNATSANNAAVTALLTNGTVLTAAAAGGTFTNASVAITNAGNGWYRVALTFTSSTETTIRFIYAVGDSSSTTGDASKGIFIWGAQLNLANMEGGVTSSLTTYYPTTTAAYYAPRFDYNPSTLQPLGLLIEEARTNSFPNSNDFSNATYWTVYGTAVATAGAATGPDGLTSASNLAGATNTTLGGDNIEESLSISASTAYTFSVFVKSNGGTTVTLRLRDSTGGSTSSVAFTVTSTWQRISLTRTMAAGATSVRCIIGQTDGDILIYGAQLEAGAFATSYIPTTTTALTRNADVASMTGTNFSSWYNASEGTLVAESVKNGNVNFQQLININDGTTNNSIAFGFGSGLNPLREDVVVSGSSVASITGIANTSTIGTILKVAGAYKVDDFAISGNGGAVATDTLGAVPVVNRMDIGYRSAGTPLTFTGTIRRIAYYPTRLPDATLQALTQ